MRLEELPLGRDPEGVVPALCNAIFAATEKRVRARALFKHVLAWT